MRTQLLACALALLPLAAAADTLELPLSHKGSGTVYVQTQLQGQAEDGWLVDTGSDYSVIDSASLEALLASGQARFVKKLRGKMADGGERIVPLYEVQTLQLAGRCELRDVKVAVLPAGTRRIMGLSALRQLAPFSLSFDPPTLHVSGCRPSAAALRDGAAQHTTQPTTQASTPSAAEKKPPAQGAGGQGSSD